MIYISGVYHRIYITGEHSQFTVHYEISSFINYVSEHQLSHIVNASHTMPSTHVNRSYVIETDQWRNCPCFRWVLYIYETTA